MSPFNPKPLESGFNPESLACLDFGDIRMGVSFKSDAAVRFCESLATTMTVLLDTSHNDHNPKGLFGVDSDTPPKDASLDLVSGIKAAVCVISDTFPTWPASTMSTFEGTTPQVTPAIYSALNTPVVKKLSELFDAGLHKLPHVLIGKKPLAMSYVDSSNIWNILLDPAQLTKRTVALYNYVVGDQMVTAEERQVLLTRLAATLLEDTLTEEFLYLFISGIKNNKLPDKEQMLRDTRRVRKRALFIEGAATTLTVFSFIFPHALPAITLVKTVGVNSLRFGFLRGKLRTKIHEGLDGDALVVELKNSEVATTPFTLEVEE